MACSKRDGTYAGDPMLHTTLYYGLLAALAIALLVAACTDLKRREIDNELNLVIAIAAPAFWWAGGLSFWPDIALHLGVALAAFAVAAGLFAIGQMGGGDVKLIAALALWFPPALFVNLLVVMAVLGFLLTMGLGTLRVGRDAGQGRGRDMIVLSALSLVAAILMASLGGIVAIPRPAILSEMTSGSMLAAVLVLQLPVIALAYVSIHAIRIFRRRKVSIAAPYGVAISGAGLWMIASQLAASGALPGLAA